MEKINLPIRRDWLSAVRILSCLWMGVFLFGSCSSPIKLTASWVDPGISPERFSNILVLSIGKDLEKRRLAEDNIKAELNRNGYTAATSLAVFEPDFAKKYDSVSLRRILLENRFDAVVTVRVLNVQEKDRWVPGNFYYGPGYFGPGAYYHGFYGYYFRVYGYYDQPGYMVTDVEVLLESNLYKVETGGLLWSGQSKAFTRDPTPSLAARYARNIVSEMIAKGALAKLNTMK